MDSLELTWENFRGFSRPTTIRLPLLTLLIGRNNVGKTSAYAPLLLLRQTLDARNSSTALLSRGGLIDAGSFRDFVSNHEASDTVVFTLALPDFSNIPSPLEDGSRVGAIELSFNSPDGRAILLQKHRILDSSRKAIETRSREKDGRSFSLVSRLLPSRASVGRPFKEVTELRREMREEQPLGFLFPAYAGLLIPRSWRENPERWSTVRDWYNSASATYRLHQAVNSKVEDFLRGISYLGPLRSLPRRTYRLAAEPPSDVGREGEFAPEMLFRLRDSKIKQRVDDWLVKLGYGRLEFDSLGEGEDYFQVHLKTDSGLRVNLAHSGVGLSQLLPLLVQGLIADDNGTFIAQQPEIHLNPAQQVLLTDFLIEVALSGRRVVVETHSEHVLLRLRRRVAELDEQQGGLTNDQVAIYYCDNRDGHSYLERIDMEDDAQIPRSAWPKGFFEEQLTDSFALSVAQSRRAKNRG